MLNRDKKLVIIGGGSSYTPEIFDGIINRNHSLRFNKITLVDIDEGMDRAQIILNLGRRMFAKHNMDVGLELTSNRREALKGADFVISQIRVGGSDARIADETIGLEMGIIGQETTGVGGFMNAMRTLPQAIAIARDIEEVCPEAWLINFTNPSGIVTEGILKHTNVKCVGLCNVPINMQFDSAMVMEVDPEEIHCHFVGLNHLSYIVSAKIKGQEILDEVINRIGDNSTLMKNIPKVEGVGELIKSLGLIPSPYLQYYYFENEMFHKQRKEYEESGETRGVLVRKIDEELLKKYSETSLDEKPVELSQRGGSLYSFAALNIIEALLSDKPVELVINTLNNGAISNLLDDDVVEVNSLISSKGIQTIPYGEMPQQVTGLVQSVKQYERLTVEAAITGDEKLALQALLNHPLLGGYSNARKAIDRMKDTFDQYIKLH